LTRQFGGEFTSFNASQRLVSLWLKQTDELLKQRAQTRVFALLFRQKVERTMNNIINLNTTKNRKITLDKPGKYTLFFFNLCSQPEITITSENIDVNILGIYIGRKNDSFYLNTTQHHKVGKSKSNLLIKGIFFDDAKFYYEGLIKIDKNAQKTQAHQKNQNIIESPDCHIESKPFLEIKANDIICTHGSTTGQISADQLHYLQTRGMKKNQAKKLLFEGFVQEIFDIMNTSQIDKKIIEKYKKEILTLLIK